MIHLVADVAQKLGNYPPWIRILFIAFTLHQGSKFPGACTTNAT